MSVPSCGDASSSFKLKLLLLEVRRQELLLVLGAWAWERQLLRQPRLLLQRLLLLVLLLPRMLTLKQVI